MKKFKMKKFYVLLLFFTLFLGACTDTENPVSKEPPPTAPSKLAEGEKKFNDNCAGCHGIGAAGTERGPSFISKIYEPNHHGNPAFHMAVKRGVRQHHWNFGNMPKISGVDKSDVNQIIDYVRWLQKEKGIF